MRDDDQFAAIDFGPAESLRITVYEADKEHFRIMIIYHKYRIDNIGEYIGDRRPAFRRAQYEQA